MNDDVVEFLKHQHDLIKRKFDEVLDADAPEGRRRAFAELRQLLAVHENAEEKVIHPRARLEIVDGDSVVGARVAEERAAKEQLAQLVKMDIASAGFLDAVAVFRDAVLRHAVREEDEEFVRLKAELGAEELKHLANAVRAVEVTDVINAAAE